MTVGLLTFFGLLMVGVAAFVSRELEATGPCAPAGSTGPLLTLGTGLGAVLALAMFLLGHHDGPNRWLWAVGGFLAPLFWCYGGGLTLNQWLDGSPAVRYERLAVVDKEADNGIENPVQVVVLRAPAERACESTWRLNCIGARAFDDIVPGKTTMTVIVKPGAFGFPWVKSVAIQNEGAGK